MPIEYQCPGCSKLLRAPDESAGKKAKCPQCGAIADVPLAQAGELPVAGVPSPFGPAENPYASPRAFETPLQAAPTPGLVELRHHELNLEETLRTAWGILLEQIGPLALMGAILFGVNAGFYIFGQIGGMAAQATDEIAVFVVFTALNSILSFVVQTYLQIGAIHYVLHVVRYRESNLARLFKVGHCALRGLGASILVALIFGGLIVLCLAPAGILYLVTGEQDLGVMALVAGIVAYMPLAALFFLRLALVIPFVVDRGVGVFAALSQSTAYMRGNKLTVFLLFLITSVGGVLFLCVTCCIGQVLYVPFFNLLICIIYLMATGQPFMPPNPRTP